MQRLATPLTTRDQVELRIIVPSDPYECTRVIDRIVRHLDVMKYTKCDQFNVEQALREALRNSMEHGNRGFRNCHVGVHCVINHDYVEIEIADEGRGFTSPSKEPPACRQPPTQPCGRGVALMMYLMHSVKYNETGNRVRLVRYRGVQHLPLSFRSNHPVFPTTKPVLTGT